MFFTLDLAPKNVHEDPGPALRFSILMSKQILWLFKHLCSTRETISDTPAQISTEDLPIAKLANAANTVVRGGSSIEILRGGSLRVPAMSRGRSGARSRSTGDRRKQFNYDDPSHNWKMESPGQMELIVKDDFANHVFSERGRMFC